MLVSYNWLQKYFKDPLPQPADVSEIFTMGIFEIDGMEDASIYIKDKATADTIFDVKVLADRNPYCLSHRYVAQELGALINRPPQMPVFAEISSASEGSASVSRNLDVKVADTLRCIRYMGRVAEHIEVKGSPAWLKALLEALGQRSINNIVDLTNYVMLETGQPLHAFDADLVKGDIQVRDAEDGEEMVLLDGTTLKLTSKMLVIADDQGALALAGIKGGKRAEISASTKRIILEAACFDGAHVRRTSQAVGIRNESSKRFENNVTPERAEMAMREISALIKKEIPAAAFGPVIDVYPHPFHERTVRVHVSEICAILGEKISEDKVIDILVRLDIKLKTSKEEGLLSLTIPLYRSDLVIAEDIAEEVGRIHGYENIPSRFPDARAPRAIHKVFHYKNLIRRTLAAQGFSEVYTHSFAEKGDMALQNPLNKDRGFLRNDLATGLQEKLALNLRNIELLGLSDIRIFEVGNVFGGKKETLSLSFGIAVQKLPKGTDQDMQMKEVFDALAAALGGAGINYTLRHASEGMVAAFTEIDLDAVLEDLPEPKEDITFPPLADIKYKKISPYPFVVRDIAVFVPGEADKQAAVLQIIRTHAGGLLVRTDLFDVFTKKKDDKIPDSTTRTSYAYRLVFQADDRTLTEQDISPIMSAITAQMNAQKDWHVR